MNCYDVIIVGGGLAGLTASLHLAKKGHQVLVFEKERYPHHKVCGEYVSNEVLPYLNKLGVSFEGMGTTSITNLELSTVTGKSVRTELPLGGMGISRYSFDHLLYTKALALGVEFKFDKVTEIEFTPDVFEVCSEDGQGYTATMVLGAFGKRSGLDKYFDRKFIEKKSAWLAVKAHYQYDDFPDNLVALHNFRGGYAGLSKTETGAVNFCYLATYDSFKKEKSVAEFNTRVVAQNPYLKEFLQNAHPIFEAPLTIAQISFHPKTTVENHVLLCGDTAGLIHPLCGNGMAMAIHSAKIASELISDYLRAKERNRIQMERDYHRLWKKAFKKRLWAGRRLQSILVNPRASNLAINLAIQSPPLLRTLIRSTHGKQIR